MVKKFRTAHPIVERWGSLVLASCLHGFIVLAVLFMPKPQPLGAGFDLPVLHLSQVTIGSAAPRRPAQQVEVAPEPKPVAPEPAPEPKPEDAVPVPKMEDLKPEPAPEPKPEPAQVTEVKPEPKPAPESVPKPVPAPEPAPSDEDLLRAAFAEARRTAKPAPKVSGGQSMLDQALSEALADAQKPGSGGIVSGAGGDGIGYLGTYRDSVRSRIRAHMTTRPRADGVVYEVTILLSIGDDGSITEKTITRSSGDAAFDSHVLRAINEAGKMEPPRRDDVKRLEIVFTSNITG